jgi:murein DD-endopeptidase MepM/ murein hydrolase activator NlpD
LEHRRFSKVAFGVAGGLVVGLALVVVWTGMRTAGAPQPVKLVEVPTPPAPITIVENLASGQTLADVFQTHGLSGVEIYEVVEAIREFESPRRLRPGTEIHLAMRPTEPPSRISLKLDSDRTLHLFSPDDASPAWWARLDSVPIVHDTVRLAGLIGGNLYDAELAGDVERFGRADIDLLIGRLSQIFAWQIDFWRDIRRNDAYRVVMAREVRPDGTVRSARVLAAEFRNDQRVLTAVRFDPETSTGPVEFYDANGEAMRGQFLLAPLDLARVTSGFSMRRFHPVLRVRRPHLGIDYGASRGTPVRATGSGVITRAGPWGGYGTAIEVRHANNLRTRYAHLSGLARGIRSGQRVSQGKVIGYVGSSGLATAAHLHYEFLQNGSHVNPARMNFPRAQPVPEDLQELFAATRDHALGLLGGIALPLEGFSATARTQD